MTGTRAEFGLMRSTLDAIRGHPSLRLQIVVTGMHLDRAHGRTLEDIRAGGWSVDAVVPWPASRKPSPAVTATRTGAAMTGLAATFDRLRTDIVLVVGDRVEAFAAGAAGSVSGKVVAHVHGGDRAMGQVDDSLRHAITKLAHLHFPATEQSAHRIRRLGEDDWRVHRVGSPGLDGIREAAASRSQLRSEFPGLRPRRFALLVLHPTHPDDAAEQMTARTVLAATRAVGYDRVVVVYPNNDPGAQGILRAWDEAEREPGVMFHRNLPRPTFLGLMRDAAVLVGNSSSGIIEAASFGTPVVDVGPRQAGRERGANVVSVPAEGHRIRQALARFWDEGRPVRFPARNVYGGGGAGRRIARVLARVPLTDRLTRKLITY